jgi:hypothetical protein
MPLHHVKSHYNLILYYTSTYVKVDSSEIQAIHRIPGKIGEARPVIVKLVNSLI